MANGDNGDRATGARLGGGRGLTDNATRFTATPATKRGTASTAQPPKKPKYDRDAAVAYARKHWTQVCSDGFIACRNRPKTGFFEKVPLDTVFEQLNLAATPERARLPDGSIIPWLDLDDCTHYISCCMGDPSPKTEKAGGLRIPQLPVLGVPGHVPYGVIGVPEFVEFMRSFHAKELKPSSPGSLPKGMEPGDVIVYKGTRTGRGGHLGLHLGGGKIACHTMCRVEADWTAPPFGHHVFLHVVS